MGLFFSLQVVDGFNVSETCLLQPRLADEYAGVRLVSYDESGRIVSLNTNRTFALPQVTVS